jgi:hypothetical protein
VDDGADARDASADAAAGAGDAGERIGGHGVHPPVTVARLPFTSATIAAGTSATEGTTSRRMGGLGEVGGWYAISTTSQARRCQR